MQHYDVAIIGAGMSGLAAGIRLAHFGKRVCIFERHNAPGGLNSFYAKDGRKYDVGLHAMTNFIRPGAKAKGAPLGKILRQLRISLDELQLCEQIGSRVAFPGVDLRFSNDFELFESEVARAFPSRIDGFRSLVQEIRDFPDADLEGPYQSARENVRRFIADPLLEDMIFCPVMYYGSAVEDDMDYGQFVIMFRSLFLEGFARPFEGIRLLMRVLLERYRASGGIRRMKTGIARIVAENGRASRLILDSGEEAAADIVLSSAGLPETYSLIQPPTGEPIAPLEGQLAFVETISVFEDQPKSWGWGGDTIVFFNDSERFAYRQAADAVDPRSGVICIPNNFKYGDRQLDEGVVRVTTLASHFHWNAYGDAEYAAEKERWRQIIWDSAKRFLPEPTRAFESGALAHDMFTPKTITRFTGRINGAIYGSPVKAKDGATPLSNLFLCGTDQGYLGVVGSMLSGIAIANRYALR